MKINLLILISVLFMSPILVMGQDDGGNSSPKRNRHRLLLGVGLNIPFRPTSHNYHPGFAINQQYEFLLGDHFTLAQGLGYNYLFGKSKTELYEGIYVDVEYEYFHNLPLQAGLGFYFGEKQRTFFIMFKGGVAWYKYVKPAYPEIVVNDIVVKEAKPREEISGYYWFFTPSIGWQFKRMRVSFSYKTHIEQDANVGLLGIGFSYNVLKP